MGLATLRGGTGEAIRRRDWVGVHTTEDIDMREVREDCGCNSHLSPVAGL